MAKSTNVASAALSLDLPNLLGDTDSIMHSASKQSQNPPRFGEIKIR
jgi:hypothetical protein